MVDKPRLSIDIYNQYVNEDEVVQWPNDPNERALLARALLGRELMAKFDSRMRWAINFLENSQPQEPFPRKSSLGLEDDYFRQHLYPLETGQKKVVRDLIGKSMVGALFSMLVTLDQSSFGEYDLMLTPSQTVENSNTSLFTALPDELHDELNDWIISFSDFADEIVELVQHPKGWWQFQPKESFRS